MHLDQISNLGEEDKKVEQEWSRKELWEAISRLPNKQRIIVVMRIAQELSYREIHKITGITEGAGKVHFHNALKSLKNTLGNGKI